MNKFGKILAGMVVIALVAGGIFWALKDDAPAPNAAPESSEAASPTPAPTGNDAAGSASSEDETSETPASSAEVATIVYDGQTFTVSGPANVGQEIKVTNNSSETLNFASDDHPTHRDNSALNVGIIAAGQSKTFSVSQAGTWGFHDHFNSSAAGQIVVQ